MRKPTHTWTWAQAAAWRLRRQYLDRRAPAAESKAGVRLDGASNMLAVASRLSGLHAQVLSASELALWARVEGLERGAVQRALWEDRTLVKTWAMRGTLHLLPAGELHLWHGALSVIERYRKPAFWKRCFGITLDEVDRLTEAIGAALDGRVMTREELIKEVRRRAGFTVKFAENGWGTILKPAAFAGHLCFGPSIGQRVRFTRPDTWLRAEPAPKLDPQSAAAEVARRFLAVYGPATYRDLARWWGGGGMAMARRWIASLGEEVVTVDLSGTPAWMLAADAKARDLGPIRSVRLLPAFDQYVVAASHHADRLLPAGLRSRVYRPQGWISPVLLVNGRMEGVWRHEITGSRVEVVIERFGKSPARVRRAAEEEAERLAAFLGCKLSVAWKS